MVLEKKKKKEKLNLNLNLIKFDFLLLFMVESNSKKPFLKKYFFLNEKSC